MIKRPSRGTFVDPFARDLMRSALPTRRMPDTSRMRGSRRVARIASAPMVALGVGLLSKVAAGGFGLGVATAVAVVVGVPSIRTRLLPPARVSIETSVSAAGPTARVSPIAEPPARTIEPSIDTATPTPVSTPPRFAPRIASEPRALQSVPTESPPPPTSSLAIPVERGISAEVGILLDARRKLETDPLQAIALLARHSGDFPAGELAMEREVLMIEALDRTGQRADAQRRAHELLARSPNAFYAARLKELIARH
jgi:hypothetical protein